MNFDQLHDEFDESKDPGRDDDKEEFEEQDDD